MRIFNITLAGISTWKRVNAQLNVYLFFCVCSLFSACSKSKKSDSNQEQLAEIGHYLFFDIRLSYNNTKSCASCHKPEFAFTDGYRTSIGCEGKQVLRNSPSLINIAFLAHYTLADSSLKNPFQQHINPLYSKYPIELGLHKDSAKIFNELSKRSLYADLLIEANIKRFNDFWLRKCLAAYIQTLQSRQSSFDSYKKGNGKALTPSQIKGLNLFNSEKLKCKYCHSEPDFTINNKSNKHRSVYIYRKINLNDSGLYLKTNNLNDAFHFRVPGLRNIALTAPYFHDGSLGDLKSVLNYYQTNDYLNTGMPVKPNFNDTEKQLLLEFLYSLSDSSIFANRKFQNPFNEP